MTTTETVDGIGAMPSSEEAEKRVIANLLMDRDGRASLLPLLEEGDFEDTGLRNVFHAIACLLEKRAPVEVETIKTEMGRLWGGEDYLEALKTWEDGAGRYWVAVVRDFRVRREARRACYQAARKLEEVGAEPTPILDALELTIREARARALTESRTMGEILGEVIHNLEAGDEKSVVKTGYPAMDGQAGGLWRGELAVLAARPSMGKTTMMLNVTRNVLHAGGRALIFSAEMSAGQLIRTLIVRETGLNGDRIRLGGMEDADWTKINTVREVLSGYDLVIDDRAPVRIGPLIARAELEHRTKPLDLVAVDYVQLVRGPKSESYSLELAAIVGDLKALAQRLSVPVLAVAQLNREPEARDDHRPRLSDLKASGGIEEGADMVMLLYRPGYYDNSIHPQRAELILAKNRNGRCGMVPFRFIMEQATFQELKEEAPSMYRQPRQAGTAERLSYSEKERG